VEKLSTEKIVIAMSGGVDSSVAAALLKQQGRDVVGISLQLWDYSTDSTERFGTCCSLDILVMHVEWQTKLVFLFIF